MSRAEFFPVARDVTIIGAGFTGLAAAYDLSKAGHRVTLLEAEPEVGGLAGAFHTDGERLDRFYHHWFTNDLAVMDLIEELGLQDRIVTRPTNTGLYYANQIFRLSTPLDLFRFVPLSLIDRIRLGLLAVRARRVRNWRELENLTAAEWLRRLGGRKVYEVVWEPLLQGKFGPYAEKVSAVWFWNKLKLRGGSRGKGGEERLAYFRGSFATLAEATARAIETSGGRILLNSPVSKFHRQADGRWIVSGPWGEVSSDVVLATPALPVIANMIRDWASADYVARLEQIEYLANICLVMQLDRPLSSTYWLNVNDPSFPFVGVIEHTNFEDSSTYGGRHIVYLSKYLPHTDPLFGMGAEQMLDFALPHLQRMFPEFRRDWVVSHDVWRARWAQPIVGTRYSDLIPSSEGPVPGFYVCSMAQVYPEDRGTNYAIRDGRQIAARLLATYPVRRQTLSSAA